MASLSWDRGAGGSRRARILFVLDGERRAVRLGAVPVKVAEAWQRRIEELVALRIGGCAMPVDLATWCRDLPEEAYQRLARVGLVEERRRVEVHTLGELLEAFTTRGDVKASTRKAYRQTAASLVTFFGADRMLPTIGAVDADQWRSWVASSTESTTRRRATSDNRLSPATVAKRVFVARAVFRRAVRWSWIAASPFDEVKAGSQANPARNVYVPREVVLSVLDACSSIEWRVIVALARFAALRCPSEVGAVAWSDVDWHRGRLTVRASKTEHHGEAHAVRFVPIEPALREVLAEAFEAAAERSGLVAPLAARPGANLRTTIERAVVRAGHRPWPRLLQNLRASAATDWVERYPAHVVARWLGHSPTIAATHYLQTREKHFEDAVAGGGRGGADSGALVAQNAAQQRFATDGNGPQITPESTRKTAPFAVFPVDSAVFSMGEKGLEQTHNSAEKVAAVERAAHFPAHPDDLAEVVAAWPLLTLDQRRRVVGIARAARRRGGGGVGG